LNLIIITCEHGGNFIPLEYQHLFKNAEDILNSHKGWDPGALLLSQALSENLKLPLFYETISRMLIELNRSLHHPSLFSSFTKSLTVAERYKIIDRFYLPYRNKVENTIKDFIDQRFTVIHLSIHSFSPVLNDVIRDCEIGFLYDPKRTAEKEFSWKWRNSLSNEKKEWRIKMNYPYKGTSDGFTTYLRKRFPESYSGIELEVNQALFKENTQKTIEIISNSLRKINFSMFLDNKKAPGKEPF
jgi:predicted N-formylglutamate amidohydrolase